jgi:hypothetical protein
VAPDRDRDRLTVDVPAALDVGRESGRGREGQLDR